MKISLCKNQEKWSCPDFTKINFSQKWCFCQFTKPLINPCKKYDFWEPLFQKSEKSEKWEKWEKWNEWRLRFFAKCFFKTMETLKTLYKPNKKQWFLQMHPFCKVPLFSKGPFWKFWKTEKLPMTLPDTSQNPL